MSRVVSDQVLHLLAQSLPLVERSRDSIVQGIETHLRPTEAPDEAFGQSEVTAMMLTGMLIEQARHLVDLGGLRDVEERAQEHRALAITGRHYSRFGDALVPVLKDVLGPNTPVEVPKAWCDAFWSVIRAMTNLRVAA